MFGYRREPLQKVDVYKKRTYSFRNILDGSLCSSWCREATNTTPSMLLWHAEFLNQRKPEGWAMSLQPSLVLLFWGQRKNLSYPFITQDAPYQKERNCLQSLSWDFLGQGWIRILSQEGRAGFITSHCVFSICSTSWKNRLQTVVLLVSAQLSEDHTLLPQNCLHFHTSLCCEEGLWVPESDWAIKRPASSCKPYTSFFSNNILSVHDLHRTEEMLPRPVQMYWQSFHQEDITEALWDSPDTDAEILQYWIPSSKDASSSGC